MRHNILRDTEAKMMGKVFRDVQIEPEVLPTTISVTDNLAEKARLGISARQGCMETSGKNLF